MSQDRDGFVNLGEKIIERVGGNNGSFQSDRLRLDKTTEVDSGDRLLPRFTEPESEDPGDRLSRIGELQAENNQLKNMFIELSLKHDTLKSTKNAQVQVRGEV